MVKEISVLIPVYNYDVSNLVRALHKQCKQELTDFEILLFDDGSSDDFKTVNRKLAELPNVTYKELPHNIGRSAIRNLLAKEAKFETLIFLDNDSGLPDDAFIRRYMEAADLSSVFSGGTIYQKSAPKKEEMLRWVYGLEREQKTAKQRSKYPYQSLTLNNLCLPKQVALQFPLEEKLREYGHEDTAFGWALEENQIPLKHIDNPVFHLGLETSDVFLQKTEQAIRNLFYMYLAEPQKISTKLTRLYQRLKKSGLLSSFFKAFSLIEHHVKRSLVSDKPNLVMFDFYKLYLFIKLAKEHKKKSGHLAGFFNL